MKPTMPDFESEHFKKYQDGIDYYVDEFQVAIHGVIDAPRQQVNMGMALPALEIAISNVVQAGINTMSEHPDPKVSQKMKGLLLQAQVSSIEARLESIKRLQKENAVE